MTFHCHHPLLSVYCFSIVFRNRPFPIYLHSLGLLLSGGHVNEASSSSLQPVVVVVVVVVLALAPSLAAGQVILTSETEALHCYRMLETKLLINYALSVEPTTLTLTLKSKSGVNMIKPNIMVWGFFSDIYTPCKSNF